MKKYFKNINKARMGSIKTFLVVLALIAGSVLTSCKDFLEEKPFVSYNGDLYFDSPNKLSMAVLGVYDGLSTINLFGANLVMLGADSDIEFLRNTSVTNGTSVEDIGHYYADPRSGVVDNIWKDFYMSINRANVAIEGASKVLLHTASDSILVKKYVAEAKAMRAFCYTYLVALFGDVPLRTVSSDMTQNLFVPRSPKAEVYAQIIKDFEEAIVDLPWYSDDAKMSGRMNKGAAMALLARACLYAGGYSLYQDGTIKRPDNYVEYYQKAEQVTNALISSGKHALNPSYEKIFRNICGNIVEQGESMFEIDMAYLYGQSRHAGQIGTVTTGVAIGKYSDAYNCSPKMFTSFFAYKKFGTGSDLRRKISIANFTLSGNPYPVWKEDSIARKSSNSWSCAKWRRDWHGNPPQVWNSSDCNFVVIRYAEVLLMRAEILNELNNGPTAEAIELVNQVRRRGFGLPIATSSTVADMPASAKTDKAAFFNYLTDEYARETLGEHHRKFHLIRWNLLKTKLAEANTWFAANYNIYHAVKTKVYLGYTQFDTGKDELLPIPYREITENKGAVVQNPGYYQ